MKNEKHLDVRAIVHEMDGQSFCAAPYCPRKWWLSKRTRFDSKSVLRVNAKYIDYQLRYYQIVKIMGECENLLVANWVSLGNWPRWKLRNFRKNYVTSWWRYSLMVNHTLPRRIEKKRIGMKRDVYRTVTSKYIHKNFSDLKLLNASSLLSQGLTKKSALFTCF